MHCLMILRHSSPSILLCLSRTLKFTSQNEEPTLSLAVDLPSLRFHIDENKVLFIKVLL